jgi:NTE family protein
VATELTSEVIDFADSVRNSNEPVNEPAETVNGPTVTLEKPSYVSGAEELLNGAALCMSGGGYRAMLFNLGMLWRLNAAGLLSGLDRVSSVSGGALTAGVLAHHWSRLEFDDAGVATAFTPEIVEPLRDMSRHSIDVAAVLLGAILPFSSPADRITKQFDRRLFTGATLQDLPDHPRFSFNAANVESGALMRFGKAYIADYRVGRLTTPVLPLAVAVQAASAIPPFFSPCTIEFNDSEWITESSNDLTGAAYRSRIHLTDGSVYDQLALESAWKYNRTIFVSDGGVQMRPNSDPPTGRRHIVRVLELMDTQVRAVKRRQVIEAFRNGTREGFYVGIRSHLDDYALNERLLADPRVAAAISTPTRFNAFNDETQELLINLGVRCV